MKDYFELYLEDLGRCAFTDGRYQDAQEIAEALIKLELD